MLLLQNIHDYLLHSEWFVYKLFKGFMLKCLFLNKSEHIDSTNIPYTQRLHTLDMANVFAQSLKIYIYTFYTHTAAAVVVLLFEHISFRY